MNIRTILILEPFCQEHLELIKVAANGVFDLCQLSENYDEDSLANALKIAEIVIGQPPVRFLQNPEVNCPNLRFIQMTWAGANQYTRSSLPFPKETVALANASGAYGMVISQFVVGQILSLMLNFKAYHNQQQQKIWERRGPVMSLQDAKVLIFGAGDIGSMTAKRFSGFDARIVGVCRNKNKVRPYFNELCTLEESDAFLKDADVVVCCIPNSDETAGFMNANRLKLMKPGAIIVNVGRGNFIDCTALNEELSNGHLWGAALDVTNPEPLPKDHPLWENPRCMITPHASGVAFGHLKQTEEFLCQLACENLKRYLTGKDLKNRIY